MRTPGVHPDTGGLGQGQARQIEAPDLVAGPGLQFNDGAAGVVVRTGGHGCKARALCTGLPGADSQVAELNGFASLRGGAEAQVLGGVEFGVGDVVERRPGVAGRSVFNVGGLVCRPHGQAGRHLCGTDGPVGAPGACGVVAGQQGATAHLWGGPLRHCVFHIAVHTDATACSGGGGDVFPVAAGSTPGVDADLGVLGDVEPAQRKTPGFAQGIGTQVNDDAVLKTILAGGQCRKARTVGGVHILAGAQGDGRQLQHFVGLGCEAEAQVFGRVQCGVGHGMEAGPDVGVGVGVDRAFDGAGLVGVAKGDARDHRGRCDLVGAGLGAGGVVAAQQSLGEVAAGLDQQRVGIEVGAAVACAVLCHYRHGGHGVLVNRAGELQAPGAIGAVEHQTIGAAVGLCAHTHPQLGCVGGIEGARQQWCGVARHRGVDRGALGWGAVHHQRGDLRQRAQVAGAVELLGVHRMLSAGQRDVEAVAAGRGVGHSGPALVAHVVETVAIEVGKNLHPCARVGLTLHVELAIGRCEAVGGQHTAAGEHGVVEIGKACGVLGCAHDHPEVRADVSKLHLVADLEVLERAVGAKVGLCNELACHHRAVRPFNGNEGTVGQALCTLCTAAVA